MARNFTRGNGQNISASVGGAIHGSNLTAISFWLMPTSLTGNQGLFCINGSSNEPIVYVNGSGNLAGFGDSSTSFTVPTGMSANVWYNLIFNMNHGASSVAVFLNGVSQTVTGTFLFQGDATNSFTIAADPFNGTSNALNGVMADVAVWTNLNLTTGEVLALSQGARPLWFKRGSQLLWWPVDGLQSPEPDLSGNANNGTVTNAPSLAAGPPVMMFTPRWHKFIAPTPPARINLGSGTYSMTVESVRQLVSYLTKVASGFYILTDEAVSISTVRQLSIGNGAYALTVESVKAPLAAKLSAGAGLYQLTGEAEALLQRLTMKTNCGFYAVTGESINLTMVRATTMIVAIPKLLGNELPGSLLGKVG